MAAGEVGGGGGEGVVASGGVGEVGGGGEGVGDVRGVGGVVGRWRWGGEGRAREEPDRLRDGGLEEAAVGRVGEAVAGEGLAEGEEEGEDSVVGVWLAFFFFFFAAEIEGGVWLG